MEQENIKELLFSLKPGDRLKYLISKYFNTQTEFAEKTGLKQHLINAYCNNKTAKISTKSLLQIQNKIGFNASFISSGMGEELIEGCELKPLLNNVIIQNAPPSTSVKDKRLTDKQPVRGESDTITLGTSGKKMKLSDKATINIVDVVFDALENPFIIKITNEVFYKKYGLKNDSIIVIDKGNFEEDDIVFVEGNRECYICEYIDGNLIDTKSDKLIDIKEVNILGIVYSKVEKF